MVANGRLPPLLAAGPDRGLLGGPALEGDGGAGLAVSAVLVVGAEGRADLLDAGRGPTITVGRAGLTRGLVRRGGRAADGGPSVALEVRRAGVALTAVGVRLAAVEGRAHASRVLLVAVVEPDVEARLLTAAVGLAGTIGVFRAAGRAATVEAIRRPAGAVFGAGGADWTAPLSLEAGLDRKSVV